MSYFGCSVWKSCCCCSSIGGKLRNRHLKDIFIFLVLASVIFYAFNGYYYFLSHSPEPVKSIPLEARLLVLSAKLSQAAIVSQGCSDGDTAAITGAYRKVVTLVEKINKLQPDSRLHSKPSEGNINGAAGSKSDVRDEVTILLDCVHSTAECDFSRLLNSVNQYYPKTKVVIAVSSKAVISGKDIGHVLVKRFSLRAKTTDIWRRLLSSVSTTYVYMGHGVLEFTDDIQLESLVNVLASSIASVTSSSTKQENSGQWGHGCYQREFHTFQVRYREGYEVTIDSCFACHHVAAPFLTYTHLITSQIELQPDMEATSGLAIWFLELSRTGRVVLACPQSVALVSSDADLSNLHDDWLGLVKHHQVERIYHPDGTELTYSCEEADTNYCQRTIFGIRLTNTPAISNTLCCSRKLSDGVKFIMTHCQATGLFCEIVDGTILGSLKFESVLPWEVDADIHIETENVTVFNSIMSSKLRKLGYSYHEYEKYSVAYSPENWMLELFYIRSLGSTRLRASGLSVTHVLIDGVYISACESPGFYGRNRYGSEIYQHVIHWRQSGTADSWMFYEAGKFAACPKPGHHSCLDQLRADGNTQFSLAP